MMNSIDEYVKKYEAIRLAYDQALQSLQEFQFAHELLKRIALNGDPDIAQNCLDFAEEQFKKVEQMQLDLLENLENNL